MNRTDVAEQVDHQLAEHAEVVRLSSQQIALIEEAENAVGQLAPIPYRYVTRFDAPEPPAGRIRLIGKHIIERWKPTIKRYEQGDRIPPTPEIIGWEIWQSRVEINDSTCDCIGTVKLNAECFHEACGRRRVNLKAYWNFDEGRPQSFGEHVRNIHINAMADDDYNMFYPTLPGNDIAHYDRTKEGTADAFRGGEVMYGSPDANGVRHPVRGGKEIRHGRREHRELTKNMHYLSPGWAADIDRTNAEKRAAREKRRKELAEQMAARMPRKLGEV